MAKFRDAIVGEATDWGIMVDISPTGSGCSGSGFRGVLTQFLGLPHENTIKNIGVMKPAISCG